MQYKIMLNYDKNEIDNAFSEETFNSKISAIIEALKMKVYHRVPTKIITYDKYIEIQEEIDKLYKELI